MNRLSAHDSFLFLGALLPDARGRDELLEPQNDAARTMFGDDEHLPQRELGRVVAAPERARFKLEPSQFGDDAPPRRFLLFVQLGGARQEDGNFHNAANPASPDPIALIAPHPSERDSKLNAARQAPGECGWR